MTLFIRSSSPNQSTHTLSHGEAGGGACSLANSLASSRAVAGACYSRRLGLVWFGLAFQGKRLREDIYVVLGGTARALAAPAPPPQEVRARLLAAVGRIRSPLAFSRKSLSRQDFEFMARRCGPEICTFVALLAPKPVWEAA